MTQRLSVTTPQPTPTLHSIGAMQPNRQVLHTINANCKILSAHKEMRLPRPRRGPASRILRRRAENMAPRVRVPLPALARHPCILPEGGEKTQTRQRRGRSNALEVNKPVGERDRRAAAKPAGNPNSRRGREGEPELRKAGGRPGRKWVKVMNQYTELFVGIDVAKRTLEVALSSGESWRVNNDAAGVARLAQELAARAPALVVLEASGGYEREVWLALIEAGVPTARVNPAILTISPRRIVNWPKLIASMRAAWCCSPPRSAPSPMPRRGRRTSSLGNW